MMDERDLMRSSILVSVSVLVVLLINGCSKPPREGGTRQSRRERQVAAINSLVDQAADVRHRFIDEYTKPLAQDARTDVIAQFQAEIRGLDASECPRDFRTAFRSYQHGMADYLPVMIVDLVPWSAVDYRGGTEKQQDPDRSLHHMETEYAANVKKAKEIRSNLKASYAEMRDVADSYGISVADVNPFQGPLADKSR